MLTATEITGRYRSFSFLANTNEFIDLMLEKKKNMLTVAKVRLRRMHASTIQSNSRTSTVTI